MSSITYSTERVMLRERVNKQIVFNDFEMIKLLKSFIKEIRKQCPEEDTAIRASPLYRIWYAWKTFHYCDHAVFWDWIKVLDSETMDSQALPSIYDALIEDSIDLKVELQNGTLFNEDVTFLIKQLINIKLLVHQKATIFSTNFTGRGTDERATSEYNNTYYINELDKWMLPAYYSSWCKVRERSCSNDHSTSNEDFYYANINFFFYVNIPFDPVLNGVPFASVVRRITETETYLTRMKYDLSSYDNSTMFVGVTDICGTPILLAGFDLEMNIIPVKAQKERKKDQNIQKYISKNQHDAVELLVLIDLYPYKIFERKFRIDSNSKYNYKF